MPSTEPVMIPYMFDARIYLWGSVQSILFLHVLSIPVDDWDGYLVMQSVLVSSNTQ